MTDLDALAEIADQTDASGFAGAKTGRPVTRPVCNSPEHMQPPHVRFYTDKGKRRALCKLCDKARRKGRVTYRPQEYPL